MQHRPNHRRLLASTGLLAMLLSSCSGPSDSAVSPYEEIEEETYAEPAMQEPAREPVSEPAVQPLDSPLPGVYSEILRAPETQEDSAIGAMIGQTDGASSGGTAGQMSSGKGMARTPAVRAPTIVLTSRKRAQRPSEDETASFTLPEFPWPPEQPSSRIRFERRGMLAAGQGASLADVQTVLGNALSKAGYHERSFYSVPGGFAVVTRLEGIDDVGTPLGEELRYQLPGDKKKFSFGSYVSNLFFAPEGYYRFVTFVVTDKPYTTSTEELSETAALSRLQSGASALPTAFSQMSFSDSHVIDALIYEYKKPQNDDPTLILPGRLPPQTHVENSGVKPAFIAELNQ